MMDYFYDKTCTINRVSQSIVDWGTKATQSVIYTEIPCAFWRVKQSNFKEWIWALEEDARSYTANVEWCYTNIVPWDYLTLFESNGSPIGSYIILDTIQYPDLHWDIDNIALTIKVWNG